MMKKVIYGLLMFLAFCGCQDDETELFDAEFPNGFSFRAIPGGTVMHYTLPNNNDVMGVRVRYQNAQGESVLKTASYACDSIELNGFNEKREGVEAFVTLCDRNNVESEPVRVTFDTEDSGPVAFFENLEITSGWHGINMRWDVPEGAKGLVHVMYLGESPFTSELDTLLVGSYSFSSGKGDLLLQPKQVLPQYSVIIRTEDFAGYTVMEKEWKDVEVYDITKLDGADIKLLSADLCKEDEESKLGIEYLFDGNTKGTFPVVHGQINTFLAGPDAFDKPFVFDLGSEKQLAQIKLYAMLNISSAIPWANEFFKGCYQSKVPSSMTIYGANDKDDRSSWVVLGEYEEIPDATEENHATWWCRGCATDVYNEQILRTEDDFEAAEPISRTFNIAAEEEQFRYLIVEVHDTYSERWGHTDQNRDNYWTLHELEVYAKAE